MLPIDSTTGTDNESKQVCLYTPKEENIMKSLLTLTNAEFSVEVREFTQKYQQFGTFLCKYKNRDLDLHDPNLKFWLNEVMPSCVYPIKIKEQISHYVCAICENIVRTQASLIRHYQEQHFDEIPRNIFGVKIIYTCDICQVNFQRESQLEQHKKSLKHQKKLAKVGNETASAALSSYMEAKEQVVKSKKNKRKLLNEQEEDLWNQKKKTFTEKIAKESTENANEKKSTDETDIEHEKENVKNSDGDKKSFTAENHHDQDEITCSQLSQLSVKD